MPMKEITENSFDRIPFKMHPRVFAALGADLVTNDVVAVIELVKNSYDAFASNVWIRFPTDDRNGKYLEIEDDGLGMTEEIITDTWCLVATPYKETNQFVETDNKSRRVAGEKGLGRLSAARLGEKLQMLTQAPKNSCWDVRVNWTRFSESKDISSCFVRYRKYDSKSIFKKSGTCLRIYGLKSEWDAEMIADLEDNLSRLISPFSDIGDFNIFLIPPGKSKAGEVKIESPDFLSKPKYSIAGEVESTGKIKCTYKYAPISDSGGRREKIVLSWQQIYDTIKESSRYRFSDKKIHCGPFSFEIRAWDIATEDTREIASRFDFQKNKVRKAIRVHKGISVYRDGILVLPKSDSGRDWLGMDLRRISKVGTRLSTSQIVGYVAIEAENNPQIKDTSDRERLVSNLEVVEFQELLKAIVSLLENERDKDRLKPGQEKPMEELFKELDTENLIDNITELAEEGAEISDVVSVVRTYSLALKAANKVIQERFIYYSRLATVGTIAQLLVHEIRNRTTAFGSFMSFVKSRFGPFKDSQIEEEYRIAYDSINSLERLADTFAPLASRGFRRKKRNSILEERINACLSLQRGDLKKKSIHCKVPTTQTHVAVDPGELDAILLNLISNAIYWLGQIEDKTRRIEFNFKNINDSRVEIWIHDNGPGIKEKDIERVFWPGVTGKPGGIGMGLTVSSELVAEYGGRMAAQYPGAKNGASFVFDLPLLK